MANERDLRLRYGQQAGDILVRGIVDAVNESIREILETRKGTRLFNRGFGSNLGNLLFEPVSGLIANLILLEVQQIVDRFEPRVVVLLNRSTVKAFPDQNLYQIRIGYRIRDTEDTAEFNTILEAVS